MFLKEIMIEKKIKQNKLAKDLGINPTTLNYYVNHKTEPDIETLKKFSQYFRVSIDELVGNEISHFISVANFSDEQKANLYLIEKLSPKNNLIANGYLLRLLQEQENS